MNTYDVIKNWLTNARKGWVSTLIGLLLVIANYGGVIEVGDMALQLELPSVVVNVINTVLVTFASVVLVIGNGEGGLGQYLKSKFLPK